MTAEEEANLALIVEDPDFAAELGIPFEQLEFGVLRYQTSVGPRYIAPDGVRVVLLHGQMIRAYLPS